MDVPHRNPTHGWIEVITGSMFSGKSEELIRRLRRAQIARQKVQIFKPSFDNRFAEAEIVSHSEMRIQGVNVGSSAELMRLVNDDTEVVGIDEAQFFDKEFARRLYASGRRGQTRRRGGTRYRLPRAAVRAHADHDGHRGVRHERRTPSAWCAANPASHTQRLVASDERLLLGAGGTYEARCRKCFDPTLAGSPAAKAETKRET
jgi:thymidine kinase